MNNEQLYKDFEALNKEASLGGGLNRIEKQHACGRMTCLLYTSDAADE